MNEFEDDLIIKLESESVIQDEFDIESERRMEKLPNDLNNRIEFFFISLSEVN